MEQCDTCKQRILNLDEFYIETVKCVVGFRKEYDEFCTKDENAVANDAAHTPAHEGDFWVSFIGWLLTDNRIGLVDLIDALRLAGMGMVSTDPAVPGSGSPTRH